MFNKRGIWWYPEVMKDSINCNMTSKFAHSEPGYENAVSGYIFSAPLTMGFIASYPEEMSARRYSSTSWCISVDEKGEAPLKLGTDFAFCSVSFSKAFCTPLALYLSSFQKYHVASFPYSFSFSTAQSVPRCQVYYHLLHHLHFGTSWEYIMPLLAFRQRANLFHLNYRLPMSPSIHIYQRQGRFYTTIRVFLSFICSSVP